MPNHVHILAAFPDQDSMLEQCEWWKRFTATRINRRIGSSGRFSQPDAFDHLLRSEEQLQFLRRYIADNPPNPGFDVATSSTTASLCPARETLRRCNLRY
jgi:REP element-mobilizing transposase RayT